MTEENFVRVALNKNGWDIYKSKNGFAVTNIDNEGYSTFSYDYFEELFYPLPFKEFCTDIKSGKGDEEWII